MFEKRNDLVNHKKSLGLHLQEIKQEKWFTDLDKDTQDEAVSQVKSCYSPPSGIENTLLNLAIAGDGNWQKWQEICSLHFPYADPLAGDASVRLHKRLFFTHTPANV